MRVKRMGSSTGSSPAADMWQLGLINGEHKYLTAETFGFKVNANGVSLKKKQTWRLEPAGGSGAAGEEVILLKSHLDKYLAVDSFGNVTCDIDEPDATAAFEMAYEKGNNILLFETMQHNPVAMETSIPMATLIKFRSWLIEPYRDDKGCCKKCRCKISS
jgi:hypothetical protein